MCHSLSLNRIKPTQPVRKKIRHDPTVCWVGAGWNFHPNQEKTGNYKKKRPARGPIRPDSNLLRVRRGPWIRPDMTRPKPNTTLPMIWYIYSWDLTWIRSCRPGPALSCLVPHNVRFLGTRSMSWHASMTQQVSFTRPKHVPHNMTTCDDTRTQHYYVTNDHYHNFLRRFCDLLIWY
jgi:hypothetical protein